MRHEKSLGPLPSSCRVPVLPAPPLPSAVPLQYEVSTHVRTSYAHWPPLLRLCRGSLLSFLNCIHSRTLPFLVQHLMTGIRLGHPANSGFVPVFAIEIGSSLRPDIIYHPVCARVTPGYHRFSQKLRTGCLLGARNAVAQTGVRPSVAPTNTSPLHRSIFTPSTPSA